MERGRTNYQDRMTQTRKDSVNESTKRERLEEYNRKYNDIFGACMRSEISQQEYNQRIKSLDREYADVITARA